MTILKPMPPENERKRLLWFIGIWTMSLTAAALTVYLLSATLF